MNRREAIIGGISTAAISALSSTELNISRKNLKNSGYHSACRWCYSKIPLGELCEKAKDIGISSIELLNPDELKVVSQYNLECAIANGSPLGITMGFNDPANHAQLQADFKRLLPIVSDYGINNIICFSGNRNELSDEQGLENCAAGLDPVLELAEKYNITLMMELLNSKVDHHDYQCDKTSWGTSLVEKIGRSNFKLLYDIYHMQIMEGDVIRTIRNNIKYFGHFHTGGVPGRNEIDETQELNYRAIVEAIFETGYKGYIAQEFIPTWDNPFKALKKAIDICEV